MRWCTFPGLSADELMSSRRRSTSSASAITSWIDAAVAEGLVSCRPLVFAGAMNFFSYWFSDKIVLKMYGGQEITATMTTSAAKRLKVKKGQEAIALIDATALVLLAALALPAGAQPATTDLPPALARRLAAAPLPKVLALVATALAAAQLAVATSASPPILRRIRKASCRRLSLMMAR